MSVAEIADLKMDVVKDLIERYDMSAGDAVDAVERFDVDRLVKDFPNHVKHYPLETLSDGVFNNYQYNC